MTREINTKEIAAKARDAKAIMACLSESEKNRVLDGFKTNLLLNKTKILEANQIICYFNYVNRSINGLGVSTEGDTVGYYSEE